MIVLKLMLQKVIGSFYFGEILLDVVVDLSGHGLVVKMRDLVAIPEHLQPGGFVGQPTGLISLLQGFAGRLGLDALPGQQVLERFPIMIS